ncbi:MAG: hypothetical protein GY859_05120 [Desulfobacterales bacterium]|nr:hypothetical protein [Desulfobacterales bacterium]
METSRDGRIDATTMANGQSVSAPLTVTSVDGPTSQTIVVTLTGAILATATICDFFQRSSVKSAAAIMSAAIRIQLDALQRSNYAAASEAPAGLAPPNGNRMKELIRLYHVASAPLKAALAFRKTRGDRSAPGNWLRKDSIYQGGRRYDLAHPPAGRPRRWREP